MLSDSNKNRQESSRAVGEEVMIIQGKWLLVSGSGAPLFATEPSAQGSHYQGVYWQIGGISVRSNKSDQGLLELT